MCAFICIMLITITCLKTELKAFKRDKTMNKQTAQKTGTFLTTDLNGKSIIFDWKKYEGNSPDLTHQIQKVSDILADTYTMQELQFTRIHPQAVPNEYFLKPLAPLFENGFENVNWQYVEKQINAIFQQFFTATDFAQLSSADEQHLLVTAQEKESEKILGVIQFISNPAYPKGTIKAGLFGIPKEAHGRGLEKLLMNSIFKLMPDVSRVFIHTRITNEYLIGMCKSWGFNTLPQKQEYWVELEYLVESREY